LCGAVDCVSLVYGTDVELKIMRQGYVGRRRESGEELKGETNLKLSPSVAALGRCVFRDTSWRHGEMLSRVNLLRRVERSTRTSRKQRRRDRSR